MPEFKTNGSKVAPNLPVAGTVEKATAPSTEETYDKVEVFLAFGEDAITPEKAKTLLGWEDEEAYGVRAKKEKPNLKGTPTFGDKYDFLDKHKRKIRCNHNNHNRPMDDAHASKLGQDILNRQWAGPSTMEGETVNGDTIVISRTAQVISGQHRLIALVFASQMWEINPDQWDKWTSPPFIETILVYGISDDPRVIGTIDNVKPRTLTDVLFTSGIYAKLNRADRLTCSVTLDNCIDLVWKRSGVNQLGLETKYQTHSASKDFLGRHEKKMLKCVESIFALNSGEGRSLSVLDGPSTGVCAGMMFLMACSNSDLEAYRDAKPPTEKKLNWDNWDAAEDFWTRLGNPKHELHKIVHVAMTKGCKLGGRLHEKLAILCKAWRAFLANKKKVESGDLKLKYGSKEDRNYLDEAETVGGIDTGGAKEEDIAAEVKEEVEKAKEKAKEENAEKFKATIAKASVSKETAAAAKILGTTENGTKDAGSIKNEIVKLRETYPGKVLFIKGPGGYNLWDDDARIGSQLLKLGAKTHDKLLKVTFPDIALQGNIKKLTDAGHKVVVIDTNGKEIETKKPAAPAKPVAAKK